MMKNMIISLFFFFIYAILKISAFDPFLSEVTYQADDGNPDSDTVGIEIYVSENPSQVSNVYGIIVFGGNFPLVASDPFRITGFQAGYYYFPLPMSIHFSQIALILYKDDSPTSSLQTVEDENVIDSVVFSRQSGPNLFSSIIPEWNDNKVLAAANFSRCNPTLRNPESFVERPSTPGEENDCDEGGAHGDPHFIQTIFDKTTHQPINICYDVTGQSRQSILILEDKLHKIAVEGVLLNDYYMHEIHIRHEESTLKINITSLISKYGELKWEIKDNQDSWTYIDNFEIKFNKKEMKIDIFQHKVISLTILIKRLINDFGIYHLDLDFEKFNHKESKDARYAGLMGDIQQKNIEITRGIQYNDQVSVKVDNKTLKGRLIRKSGKECIQLSFKDLIRPKSSDYYIRSVY